MIDGPAARYRVPLNNAPCPGEDAGLILTQFRNRGPLCLSPSTPIPYISIGRYTDPWLIIGTPNNDRAAVHFIVFPPEDKILPKFLELVIRDSSCSLIGERPLSYQPAWLALKGTKLGGMFNLTLPIWSRQWSLPGGWNLLSD